VGMSQMSESMTTVHSGEMNIHGAVSSPLMNIRGAVSSSVTVTSSEMNIHAAVSLPEMKLHSTLSSPEMNIYSTVSSAVAVLSGEMNIHGAILSPVMSTYGAVSSPGMNIHAAVSSPEMNIYSTMSSPVAVHSSEMNIRGAVSLPKMNIHEAISSPEMNIHGTVSSPVAVPLISFAQTCVSNFRTAGVMTFTQSSVSWPVPEVTGGDALIPALSAPCVSVLSGVLNPALSKDENMNYVWTVTSCCPGLITTRPGCISIPASSQVTCISAVSSVSQVTHAAVTSMANVCLHSSTAVKPVICDMFRVDSPASFSTLASVTQSSVSAVACVAGVTAPTAVATLQLGKYKLYSGLSPEYVDSRMNAVCLSYSCGGTLSFPPPVSCQTVFSMAVRESSALCYSSSQTTVRSLPFIPRVLSVKQNYACSAECAVEPSSSTTFVNISHSPVSCQAVSSVSVAKSSVSSVHTTAVCFPASSVPCTNSDTVSTGVTESTLTAVKSAVSSTCATYSEAVLDATVGKSSTLNVQATVCVPTGVSLSDVSDSGISEVSTAPLTSAVSVSSQTVPSTAGTITAGSKLSAACNSSLQTTLGLTTVSSRMDECSVTDSCSSAMKTAVVGALAVHAQPVNVALQKTSGLYSKPLNTSVTCSSLSGSFAKPRMLTYSSVSNHAVNTGHSLPSATRLSTVSRPLHSVRPVRSIAVARLSSLGSYSSALVPPTRCRPWKMPSVPVSLSGSTVPLASAWSLQRSSYRPDARLIRPMSFSALAPSARLMPSFQGIRYASSVSYTLLLSHVTLVIGNAYLGYQSINHLFESGKSP